MFSLCFMQFQEPQIQNRSSNPIQQEKLRAIPKHSLSSLLRSRQHKPSPYKIWLFFAGVQLDLTSHHFWLTLLKKSKELKTLRSYFKREDTFSLKVKRRRWKQSNNPWERKRTWLVSRGDKLLTRVGETVAL